MGERKYYGRAKDVADKIVEAFEDGDVPEALATAWINGLRDIPMNGWSARNRIYCQLAGCTDARGYKQWQKVDRHVKEGESASAYILAPRIRKWTEEVEQRNPETGEIEVVEEERSYCYAFAYIPVYDVSQTDGEDLEYQEKGRRHIEDLPLLALAEEWGLDVRPANTLSIGAAGYYSDGADVIALGVENVSTWLHELMHAADHKLGTHNERPNHWRSEAVAELGSAVLAHILGRPEDADEGGAYKYISAQARKAERETHMVCSEVVNRVSEVIEFIFEEHEKIEVEEQEGELAPA